MSSSSTSQDFLAQERDAKFKAWLQKKSVRDKAFEYLAKLNCSRATDEDSLKEVAISLCAVDRLLGNDEEGNSTTSAAISTTNSIQLDGETARKGLVSKGTGGPVEMTMKKMWLKWTNENHTFENVTLSKADQDAFSGAVKEYMDFERDDMGKPISGAKCWLPSLKYTFPAVPKPGEKAKPLTNDQKQQNLVFSRECRKLWREALSDLRQRIADGVSKLERKKYGDRGGDRDRDEDDDRDRDGDRDRERERSRKDYESSTKAGAAGEMNSKSSHDYGGSSSISPATSKKFELVVLNEISLKRLREWVDEDEDKMLEREREKLQEKNEEAKKMHQQFVRKKDELRIRLPDPSELPRSPIPRMDHANRADAPVRPKLAVCAKSTVDMLAHTGAKYAYAQSKGRWVNMGDSRVYIEGDLDKSRKKLLDMGIVYKENFDEDDDSKYHITNYTTEKRENIALKEKREREEKTKEESSKAYDDWIQLKSIRDQAIRCLALLVPPVLCVGSRNLGLGSIGTGPKSAWLSSVNKNKKDEGVQFVIDVGKALKSVDRNLLKDWAKWCEKVQGPRLQRGDPDWTATSSLEGKEPSSLFTPNIVAALWESFPPVACDVHSASYSQVRDVFMKLANRPGLDFKATFNEFADRTLSKKVNRIVDREGRMSNDEKAEYTAKVRADLKENLTLSKEEMTSLLVEMGIVMKAHEMRTLVDAFDADGDGVVTLKEFLAFTGPKRDRHGGALQAVSGAKCCWLTTCMITGMPNAYSVSNLTKQVQRDVDRGLIQMSNDSHARTMQIRKEGRSKQYGDSPRDRGGDRERERDSGSRSSRSRGGERGGGGDGDESYAGGWDNDDKTTNISVSSSSSNVAGRMVIREMKNGEKRMCVELRERVRREDMLIKLGAISDLKDSNNGGKDQEENEHENYDDDFDDGEQKTIRDDVKSCDVCDWSMEKRRKGLKFLNSITYQAQQEVHLMGLLSNGTVPNAPKLWEGSTGCEGINVTATAKWQGSSLRASGTIKGSSRMDDSDLSSPTEIMLHWGPYKEDSVSFFSLEFAGPSMSTTRTLKYKEIFRDPEDASPDSEFRYNRLIEGLIPGTSYAFRLRGFNGFGPGEYTYKVFTTRPAAPSCPRITSIASDAVTLRWVFSSSFFKHIDELKNVFNQADSDKSGSVNREELAVAFEDSGPGSCSSELKLFLHKVALKIGLDITQGYLALFDMIEGDDDGVLSWDEFENFFMSSGWASSVSVAGSVRGSVTSLHTAVTGDTKRGADSSTAPSGLTYVVERCKNEFLGDYTEEVRTSAGQTVVHRLEPGASYRFRVYAVNVDGIRGPSSSSVVVHAMLEMPSAPAVVLKYIGSRGVSLTWKRREQTVSSTRDKATVQKMLGDWAGTHGEDDGGVSVETAFARYDSNRSGTIELDELELLLKDLGVDATEERLRDAMATFDVNNDGVISFEEFGVWWRRDDVSYTIKRSDAITAVQGMGDRTDVRTSLTNMSIRSDKGRVRGGSALRSSRDSQNNDDRSVMTTHSAFQSPTNMSVRSSSAARTRPPSVTGAGAGGGRGEVPSAAIKVRQRQVAVPVVSYRGGQTKCDIAGLEPNRLYHFKLRYSGPRSHSILSLPLILMTLPLPPSCPPLIVTLEATTVRIKVYAPEYGTNKFLIQLRAMTLFPGNPLKGVEVSKMGGTGSNPGGGSSFIGGCVAANRDINSGDWVTVYHGMETLYTCTTMHTDADYECRYFCVNCQGAASESSPIQSFSTLHRDDVSQVLNHRNAEQFFSIECTGDICVGDTVLMTERLFSKPPKEDTNHNGFNSNSNSNLNSNLSTSSRLSRSGSFRAIPGGPKNTRLNSAAVDRSTMSVISGATSSPLGTFIGERTIAAYVVKDNYRSCRDELNSLNIVPKDLRRFGKYRRLWLELVWQKSSNEACKRYELKPGAVIERQQGHLEQFEVFRGPWKMESKRKSLHEEWTTNSDSFQQIDC